MSNSLAHLQMFGNEEVYKEVKANMEFLEKKEKLIEDLQEIKRVHGWDKEKSHIMADDLLLSYINDDKISQAFNDIEKWYA